MVTADEVIEMDMVTANTIIQMRGWLSDITLPDDIEVGDLYDDEVIEMVDTAYEGGIAQFIADA